MKTLADLNSSLASFALNVTALINAAWKLINDQSAVIAQLQAGVDMTSQVNTLNSEMQTMAAAIQAFNQADSNLPSG